MATVVYSRIGHTWSRRCWLTNWASAWATASRVPRSVRAIGDSTPPGGNLVVEFDTKTKTAKCRPMWRT